MLDTYAGRLRCGRGRGDARGWTRSRRAAAGKLLRQRLGAIERGHDEIRPGVRVGASGGEAGEDVIVKGRHEWRYGSEARPSYPDLTASHP